MVEIGKSNQAQYEKRWLQEEMNGFFVFDSEAWELLTRLYGPKISKDEIISLGQVTAMELNLDFVREYKRRKETMVKWFQNHFVVVRPFLQECVKVLRDEDVSNATTSGKETESSFSHTCPLVAKLQERLSGCSHRTSSD